MTAIDLDKKAVKAAFDCILRWNGISRQSVAAAIQAYLSAQPSGWLPIAQAKENMPYQVMYANANPPYYEHAVLYNDDEGYCHWMNCLAGWLNGSPCITDYIDEIDTPTHFQLLPQPPAQGEVCKK